VLAYRQLIQRTMQDGVAGRTFFFVDEQAAFALWKAMKRTGDRDRWGAELVWNAHGLWVRARIPPRCSDELWERPFTDVQRIGHAMRRPQRELFGAAVTEAADRIWPLLDDHDRRWWAGRALGFASPPRGGYSKVRIQTPFEVLENIGRIQMGQRAQASMPDISAAAHATLMASPLYGATPVTDLRWGFQDGQWVFRDWRRPT
jgi:hypothetical protein